MQLRRWAPVAVVCACVIGLAAMSAPAPGALADEPGAGVVPSTTPSPLTPAVLDGAVTAIVAMGDVVVLGGSFTRIASAGGGDVVEQSYIAAYDRRTGELLPGFRPELDAPVEALERSEDGQTVYVGGSFEQVNAASSSSVAKLELDSGEQDPAFHFPGTDTDVRTMARRDGRLYIGGSFERVGDSTQRGLAAVSASTGQLLDFGMPELSGTLGGVHGDDMGRPSASSLDVTADGTTMVVVGNFSRVGQSDRTQIAMIGLEGDGRVTGWSTQRYRPRCARGLYTYMRGVRFSPDGSYFAVVTSGGGYRGTLCDTAARWETASPGPDQKPSWVNRTGGDTLLSVAVTGSAVYVGGHQRWMNNPDAFGRAGAGAVPRPSLAALSPLNGMPNAWNPGRNPRGHGVSALWADDAGVLVGGDTSWIGNHEYLRPRIASFSTDGGRTLPTNHLARLPGTVYLWGRSEPWLSPDSVRAVEFTGTRTAGPSRLLTDEQVDADDVRGMFVVDDTIFFGHANGQLYRRPINGRSLGSPEPVDPYNDPEWAEVQTGSGETYRGQAPDFYQEIPAITGMFYWKGRLYYTLRNSPGLFWRQFSTDSGTVETFAHRAKSALDWGQTRGVFRSGKTLYFARQSSDLLRSIGFDEGRPVGDSKLVSGASLHGVGWNSRGSFVYNRDVIE